jgi:hypothetical protein
MCKALCVAILLITTMAAAQANRSTGANTIASPVIVAKKKLPNQSATIPTTTIFTPVKTGLYRLSVYATIVVNNQQYGGASYFNLAWTDDSGPQALNSVLVSDAQYPGQFYQNFNNWGYPGLLMGGPGITFEAVAGQPITYSVTSTGVGGSTYSLYYTLEQLE